MDKRCKQCKEFKEILVKGRDISSGMPKQMNIRIADLLFATEKYIEIIKKRIIN